MAQREEFGERSKRVERSREQTESPWVQPTVWRVGFLSKFLQTWLPCPFCALRHRFGMRDTGLRLPGRGAWYLLVCGVLLRANEG